MSTKTNSNPFFTCFEWAFVDEHIIVNDIHGQNIAVTPDELLSKEECSKGESYVKVWYVGKMHYISYNLYFPI